MLQGKDVFTKEIGERIKPLKEQINQRRERIKSPKEQINYQRERIKPSERVESL